MPAPNEPSAGRKTGPADRVAARKRRFRLLPAIVALSLLLALTASEVLLRVFDLPEVHRPPTIPDQFAILKENDGDTPVYVNLPSSRIRFVYDGNPRGAFGPGNVVDHFTNAGGFRGGEFNVAPSPGVLRLAFLGDSFTFGEGVAFDDTYPEVTARQAEGRLASGSRRVEALNFGVGGYNTRQSLYALRRWVLPCRPDAVVLGYVLNDAEEPLYIRVPGSERPVRRRRELDAAENREEAAADMACSGLRVAQVVRRFLGARQRNRGTVAFYRSLYAADTPGWHAARAALREIGSECRRAGIPFYVVCFPVLLPHRRYPLAELHDLVGREAVAAGARFLDLLPVLGGGRMSRLWVHPADQHPNETAHAAVAAALVERLAADGVVPRSGPEARTVSPDVRAGPMPPGGTAHPRPAVVCLNRRTGP